MKNRQRTSGSFYTLVSSYLHLQIVVVTVLLLKMLPSVKGCGGFYEVPTNKPKTIFSPSYSDPYPDFVNCIWIFESGHKSLRLRLRIDSFSGERFFGKCSDYLEIWDGVRDNGDKALKNQTLCDQHKNVEIVTTNRWLFINFRSDRVTTTGQPWIATISSEESPDDANDSIAKPPACRSYQFECTNRLCLSLSYRCDRYNDCGTSTNNDESGCGQLSLDPDIQIGISVGVGLCAFFALCIVVCILESKNKWVANRNEEMINKENKLENTRRKASRIFSKFIGDTDKGSFIAPNNSNRNRSGFSRTSSERVVWSSPKKIFGATTKDNKANRDSRSSQSVRIGPKLEVTDYDA